MSLIKGFAKETALYGISYIIPRVLNFILVTIYLSWLFNTESSKYLYSIYRELYAFIGLFLTILSFRLETAFFRYVSEEKDKPYAFSTAFQLSLIASVVFMICVSLAAKPIAELLGYVVFWKLIIITAFITITDVLSSIPFAKLRIEHQAKRYAFIRVSGIFINIALLLLCIEVMPRVTPSSTFVQNYIQTPEQKLYWVFIANVIASTYVLICLLPEIRNSFSSIQKELRKRMLKYSWPLVLAGIATTINSYSSVTLQKYFLPGNVLENLSESSSFALASSVAVLMSLFTTAFSYAAEPFFFRHKHADNAKEMYAKITLAFTLVAMIMFLGICVNMPFIQYLFGKTMRGDLYLVPMLLFANVLLGIYYNISVWFKLSDKTHFGALIAIGGSVITLIVNMILLPRIGKPATAIATLLCFTFMVVASFFQGQKYYPVPYAINKILLYLIAVPLIYLGYEYFVQGLEWNVWVKIITGNVIVVTLVLWMYKTERAVVRF